MKTMYIANNTNVVVDTEKQEFDNIYSERDAISRIYIIPEKMKVIVKSGEKNVEFDAEADDILITFYESSFDVPAVIVKSKDWLNNIKGYNRKVQEEKERWAQQKAARYNTPSDSDDTAEPDAPVR